MSIFRRKRRPLGKGSDNKVSLRNQIEVLNYTPLDYMETVQYRNFKKKAANKLADMTGKNIEKSSWNKILALYDAYIDAEIRQMKEMAKEQYVYHMYVIRRFKGLLDGELVMTSGHWQHLKDDEARLEQEIQMYRQLASQKTQQKESKGGLNDVKEK